MGGHWLSFCFQAPLPGKGLGTRFESNYVTKADSVCQIIMLKGRSGAELEGAVSPGIFKRTTMTTMLYEKPC